MSTLSASHLSHHEAPPRVSLGDDDFTLLGVPRQYAQDAALLDAQWRALQARVHPDRHVSADPAAQRLATQWSVRLNEAYQRLRHPVRRAAYLCELGGVAVHAESATAMPADFLQQQWVWRETLEDAQTLAQIEQLHQEVGQSQAHTLAAVARQLDHDHDVPGAAQSVRCLFFLDRFLQDIERRLDDLSA